MTRTAGPFRSALSRMYGYRSAESVVYWMAEDLRRRHASAEPPFDPRELARCLGVSIERRHLHASGALDRLRDGQARILLPHFGSENGSSRRRENFTIAHEIGHLIIRNHLDGALPASLLEGGHRDEEYFCDIFASELLVPRSSFMKLVRRHGLTPTVILWLRDQFDVSTQVVVRKLADALRHQFIGILWEATSRSIKATWTSPPGRPLPELPCTGHSSVERAANSSAEQAGKDTFIIGDKRSNWKCISKRIGSSSSILTVGLRAGCGITLGALLPLPSSTQHAEQLTLF